MSNVIPLIFWHQKSSDIIVTQMLSPVDLVVILAAIQSINLKVTCKIGIEGHFVRECTGQRVMVLN